MTQTEIKVRIKALEKELETVKGTKTQIYSRIVGYYQPLTNWNAGQVAQYHNRREYEIPGEGEVVI